MTGAGRISKSASLDCSKPASPLLARGPSVPFITEAHISGRHPVAMMRARQPAGDFSEDPYRDLVLTRVLRSEQPVTRDFGGGRRRVTHRRKEYELTALGFGAEIVTEGVTEIECVLLPLAPMGQFLAEDGIAFDGDFGVLHAVPFRDVRLDSLVDGLWREAREGGRHCDLAVEAMLLGVAACLLRLRDAPVPKRDAVARRLDDAKLSQVEAFVEDSIAERFTTEELAGLCGLSRFQFARAFKATTGATPHAYVLARRVARARELLETGRLPLAEIAYACGFSSQSHMTDVFRRKTGVTPGRYRSESTL